MGSPWSDSVDFQRNMYLNFVPNVYLLSVNSFALFVILSTVLCGTLLVKGGNKEEEAHLHMCGQGLLALSLMVTTF